MKKFKFELGDKVSYKLKINDKEEKIITGVVVGQYRTNCTNESFPKLVNEPVNILAIMVYMPVGATTPEIFWKEENEVSYVEGSNAA